MALSLQGHAKESDLKKTTISNRDVGISESKRHIETNFLWSHTETEANIQETNKTPDVPLLYHQWEGRIDNQEVRMACARQDKVLIGELMMKNEVGTEFLRVLGMIDMDGEILFNVYDTESVCALRQTFLGHIIGNTLECFDEATQTEFKLRASGSGCLL